MIIGHTYYMQQMDSDGTNARYIEDAEFATVIDVRRDGTLEVVTMLDTGTEDEKPLAELSTLTPTHKGHYIVNDDRQGLRVALLPLTDHWQMPTEHAKDFAHMMRKLYWEAK